MTRNPVNARAATGFAKGKAARASFMAPNPVPLKLTAPTTDEKEKTISLANLRRVSIL